MGPGIRVRIRRLRPLLRRTLHLEPRPGPVRDRLRAPKICSLPALAATSDCRWLQRGPTSRPAPLPLVDRASPAPSMTTTAASAPPLSAASPSRAPAPEHPLRSSPNPTERALSRRGDAASVVRSGRGTTPARAAAPPRGRRAGRRPGPERGNELLPARTQLTTTLRRRPPRQRKAVRCWRLDSQPRAGFPGQPRS